MLFVFLTGAIIFSTYIKVEESNVFNLYNDYPDSSIQLEHVKKYSDKFVFEGNTGISLIGIPVKTAKVRDLHIQLDISYSGDTKFLLTADVYGLDGKYDDHRAQREFTIDQRTTSLEFTIPLDANRPKHAYFRLFGEIPSGASVTSFILSITDESVHYPTLLKFFSAGSIILLMILIALGSIILYQNKRLSETDPIMRHTSLGKHQMVKKQLEIVDIIGWASLIASVQYLVFHIGYNTILFADGSYSAITALSTLRWDSLLQGISNGYFSRFVVHTLFNLFPLVLKQLGVESVQLIISSLALGHIIWTFLIYGVTLHYLHRSKRLMLMSLTILLGCFTLFFTGFFMSIESGLLAAVYWLILIYILFMSEEHRSIGLRSLIIICAIALGGIHEFSSVLTLILIAILFIQIMRKKIRINIYWILLIVSLLFSSALGWKGILQPRDSGTKGQFIRSIFGIDRFILMICLLMLFVFLFTMFTEKNGNKQQKSIIISLLVQGVLSVVLVIMSIFRYIQIAYGSYDARIMNFVFPFALTMWICMVDYLNIHIPEYLLVPLTMSFLLAVVIFSTLSTVTYSKYLDGISDYLTENPGIHEVSNFTGPFEDYNWGWSAACESVLSQVIYDDKVVLPGAISANDGSWEPFDSENVSAYPDLSKYGIIYDFH